MGTQKTRGAEILLEVLRSEGTRYIFGNPGTTELPLIDALIVNSDFRYVWGLQEATVVSMADGYSQASGKPAFVIYQKMQTIWGITMLRSLVFLVMSGRR
jgi:benzoylformate decarboxylase